MFYNSWKNCCKLVSKLNTLATMVEVWVPTVTLLALATVPRPVLGINTFAIPSAYVIRFVTLLTTNCPIKNHRKGFIVSQSGKISWGEIELVFSDNKGIAAWIEVPDVYVVIYAIGFHSNIFQSSRNIQLVTPNPRARPVDYITFAFT